MKIDKAFLIGIYWGRESREFFEESINELEALAKTANVYVKDIFIQNLTKPNTRTYINKGKLKEIRNKAKRAKINTLIFNNNLTPSQSRNLANISHCNIVDRTELILDIFAKHARTKQAKLQVELAQLEYAYTKLKRKWKHLSRIQGGIGFRGPGETQIEVDRREIQVRTTSLKKKLENIEQISQTKRKRRKNYTSIALIGYTNAGKTTLFNKLTNEKRYTADKLFATLDAKTRSLVNSHNEEIVITDTIGFIRKLPHRLIKSFHSTLLEVLEADLLLNVIDVSHPHIFDLIKSVANVLEEIGAETKNVLMIFNKIDKMNGTQYKFLKKKLMINYPDSVFISAKNSQGVDKLNNKIDEFITRSKKTVIFEVPVELPKLLSFIHENGDIVSEKYEKKANINILKVKIHRQYIQTIKKQIKDFKLNKYINK